MISAAGSVSAAARVGTAFAAVIIAAARIRRTAVITAVIRRTDTVRQPFSAAGPGGAGRARGTRRTGRAGRAWLRRAWPGRARFRRIRLRRRYRMRLVAAVDKVEQPGKRFIKSTCI